MPRSWRDIFRATLDFARTCGSGFGGLCRLDLSHPFVGLVWEFKHGRIPIQPCIDFLQECERRHGLQLIAPSLSFTVGPEEIEVVDDARFGPLIDADDKLEVLLQTRFFPFLNDTHAVVIPARPDDCSVVFEGRYFYLATARGYAQVHTEWANRTRWLGVDHWTCPDFLYCQGLSEIEYEWISALHRVVEEKTRIMPRRSS